MKAKTTAVFPAPGPGDLSPAAMFAHIPNALAIGLRSARAIAETGEMQEESALRHVLNASPMQEIKLTPSPVLIEQRNAIDYLQAAVSVARMLTPYESLKSVLDALQGIGGDITRESIRSDRVVRARYLTEVALGTREPFAD